MHRDVAPEIVSRRSFNRVSNDIQLGRRICIYGRGGKTSLSRALGHLTGLPVIELDTIFWLPNWVERDHEEMRAIVLERLRDAEDGWILDGNYSRIRPYVLPKADTVIWLNMPASATFMRIVKRTLLNVMRKTQICGENYESWHNMIAPDSVVWYNAFHSKQSQRRVGEDLMKMGGTAVVYELRSYRELSDWYRKLGIDLR